MVHPKVVDLMKRNRGSGRRGLARTASVVTDRDGAATIPLTPLVVKTGPNPSRARFLPYGCAWHGCFLSTEDVPGWLGHRGGPAGQKADPQYLPRLTVNVNLLFTKGFAGRQQNQRGDGFLVGVAGEEVASPGVTQQLRPDREVTR